ncbi:MAG: insulinase family protein [Acidimicrobiia bacterium]|nr:insulinase family protein [Acidimicrobiia bacterium]
MTVRSSLVSFFVVMSLLAGLLASPAAAAEHDDAYQDVVFDNVHTPAIEALDAVGLFIDTECPDGTLCPEEPIRRWEMAVWLGRAIYGTHLPQDTPSKFGDLDDQTMWAAPYIDILVEDGVIEECATDPLSFCPTDTLTRAEIATALARVLKLPRVGYAGFGDLQGIANADDINSLAAAGITVGCSDDPLLFCPSAVVTRGQMAALLARALGLVPLPGYQPATDLTPLPTDPAVRVGTLDNGYTYYVRQNDKPGNSVSLRLVVNVGSVNEPEPQLGLAHFVEHMLFRGTAAYTAEEFNTTLRSLGVEFGPDLNAGVWYDQTVYDLTVTTDPAENVNTAMHVLSQMGHAALIEPEAVESERGVVLDEVRFRTATASGSIAAEFDRVYTQGTQYEGYYPIGTADGVESTTVEDLRRFYETWYVPSNMAIVAVGDLPADELFSLVEEHFGSIEAGTPPDFSLDEIAPNRTASYDVVTDDEYGFSFISLDIRVPTFDYATVGGERLLMLENLAATMVQNRLEDAFYRGELTQVDVPQFFAFNHNQGLRYYGTNWQGENLDTASRDYVSVLQTVQRYGFNDDDIARATEAYATSLEYQLDNAASTRDAEYAGRYVAHFLSGVDISGPQERYDRLSALLEGVTAEELTDHFRWLMNQAGLIVIAVGPDVASVPTTSELESAVEAAAPRSEPPPIEPEIDRLMEVPEPVTPVATRSLPVLDATEWEFANGARVVFVYSDIEEATVNIRARSLGGWSTLYPGARALAPRAVEAVFGSGFGDLSKLQMDRYLGESTAGLSAVILEREEGFDGGANPEDLETLFQLLHLAVTAPRVDDLAFGQAFNGAAIRTSFAEVNPAWQAWVAYNEARFGTEWHHPVATHEQLATLSADSLLSLYQQRLDDVDDMMLAVVGDTSAEDVERLARLYIGTLPAGDADTYVDLHTPAPTELVRREIPVTADKSAVLEMYHDADIAPSPSVRVNAGVLDSVLSDRLTRFVREELGASYVAGVSIQTALVPRPTAYSTLFYTVDADGYDDAYNRVVSILADLVANGPTAEELEQAKTVLRADYSEPSNGALLSALIHRLHLDDSNLLTSQNSLEELDAVTVSSVRALATVLYGKEGRVEIVRVPTVSPDGGG